MSIRSFTAAMACFVVGISGCGPTPTRQEMPVHPIVLDAVMVTEAAPPAATPLPDGAIVPLATLLDLAQRASPNRALFEANRAAAEAAVRQAGVWSNPELEMTAGRARARQENEDGQKTTTTLGGISLKQRFELPGKRSARIAAAEANRTLSVQATMLDRLDLEAEVRLAALAVVSADAKDLLAKHTADLSAQVRMAVERRMQAGETDRGDVARAQADDATAHLATAGSTAEAAAARAALNIWCGDALPVHFTVSGLFPESLPAVALVDVQRRVLASHPRLAIYAARQAAQGAAISAEERAWYPDLTLGVSGNRETDTNDVGISVGIDLPLWNRNEAGIAQAHADLARSHAEQRKELLALQREVLAMWSAYDRERQQIIGLTASVIPAAQQALQYKLAAFAAGDASLLEVIDARRSALTAEAALSEARERAAEAFMALTTALGGDPLMPPAGTIPPITPSIAPTGAQP